MRAKTLFPVILAATLLVLVLVAVFVTQPMRPRSDPPPTAAEPARLRRDVMALSGIRPRNLEAPANLDAAARYVSERWQSEGLDVHEQSFEVKGERVRNLSVLLGPEGGVRLVVGAHYDAFGPFPGADDNASGVAGLLELGRLLRMNPPGGSVELVAYALEEPPWFGGPQMGSAVHAASLRTESVHVRGMIALEMIGCFSDAPGSQSYPSAALKLIYPTRGTFVAVAGRPQEVGFQRRVKRAMADATDLPVRSITGPASLAGIDLSDNRSYWEEGYRAVMVTDTAFNRNTRYHTAQDTPDLLDYDRMAKVVTGVFAAVRALEGS
jgi:hypothetical protein